MGTELPEGGYHGEYVDELAQQIVAGRPRHRRPARRRAAGRRSARPGYALQLQQQQDTLDGFSTHFDVWYSERTLHSSGAVERGLDKLREQGHVFEADGAVWLRTTDFDDDKDRVLVKADGELTYFASDTAYYVDKRARGFDVCIYLLGADHHGYVNRLRAVAACAGDDPDSNIEVLIGQLVKMYKGGEEVRLSKRAGNIITLEDLVDEVGVDAARYSLIRYPVDSPLTLDLDLLVSRSNDNPVFYVQYAHARISLGPAQRRRPRDRLALGRLRPVAAHPRARGGAARRSSASSRASSPSAAELREPHRVARYLEELANGYHKFYDAAGCCRGADAERRADHHRAPVALRRRAPDPRQRPRCSASPRPSGCELSGARNGDGRAVRPRSLAHARTPRRTTARRDPRRLPAHRRVPADAEALHALDPRRLAERARRGPTARVSQQRAVDDRRRRRARPRGRVRHPALRARRGRLPARARPRSARRTPTPTCPPTSSTPARRSSPRRVARWVAEEGLGLDVCTGGELLTAVRAGFPAERIAFHGNNKSVAELELALEHGVGRFVVDSFEEIVAARRRGRRGAACVADVLVRVTVGVEAHTHEFIATAHEDQKFGFSLASGAGRGGRAPHRQAALAAPGRAALAHRLADLRHRRLRGRGAPARRARRAGPRRARRRGRRARPRRRHGHRLRRRRRPDDRRGDGRPAARHRRARVRGARAAPCRGWRSSPVARSSARRWSRSTRSARSRRSTSARATRAPTSASTAG